MADDTLSLATKYRTRWGALKTERASWFSHWKEISDYLLPRSGRYFVQDRNRGYRRHNAIYDSTATRALRVLAAGMMSGMTSPARPWFRLATSDPDLMKFGPVKVWLNETSKVMHRVFQRSNTYQALHSIYEELGAFGTASSILVPDFANIIHHYPQTIGEYCVSANWKGEVDTLYREFQRPVGAVVKEFGLKNVSNTVKNMYDRGLLDQWVTILHSIEPRADRDPGKLDAKNMAWKSVYLETGAGAKDVLRESGFKRFPALCPRWAVAGGDIYGNSPGMEALGDIKQLQQEQLRKAEGIDYKIRPPLQAPVRLKNAEVDTLPGGLTYVDAGGQRAAITSLYDVNIDLSHLLNDIQDVRGRINGVFYADLFLMLANQQDTRMTATEVAERHEEKLLMLGPVLERLQHELLDPLIDMTFNHIMEAGIMPPPPDELQGHEISVELVSMLAQAQRAVATNSIDRFVGQLEAIGQIKPGVLDKFDEDKWADIYADSLGIDPQLLVADDQVQAIRQQRAQAQQQQQQEQAMQERAKTAATLASAKTNEPNALTDVTQAFSGYTGS
jgi:hypothetical protein